MEIRIASLSLPGVIDILKNPLPSLRNPNPHRFVVNGGSMSEEEMQGFGENTAERVLPYLMQDRYDRNKKEVSLKTIVMENDVLEATFLPDYGGKLYSLIEKATGRDLIFANPIVQPGNLAIRDAWMSGGIEWNISHFGHTFTTCEAVFFAKMKADDGEEFLRMYQYERQKQLFWQIDFHLPESATTLQAYVRVINEHEYDIPMYWWTNTACVETPGVRLFSGTSEVLFQDRDGQVKWMQANPDKMKKIPFHQQPIMFMHKQLPMLEDGRVVGAFDATYPGNFQYSNEYYFQNSSETLAPWQGAGYEDGFVFFERSSQPLRTRKLFCWGRHRGGRLWCDYLSAKGKGDYVELQAGLTPTQVHGYTMSAKSDLEFIQVFGCLYASDAGKLHGEWESAKNYAEQLIDQVIPAEEIQQLSNEYKKKARLAVEPENLLHTADGWGALEAVRRHRNGDAIPQEYYFPVSTLSGEQMPWLQLLDKGYLPALSKSQLPDSYMTDDVWRPILERSLQMEEGNHAHTLIVLGVLQYENNEMEIARQLWEKAGENEGNPLAYRNIARMESWRENYKKALYWMEKAISLLDKNMHPAFAEEYLKLLKEEGMFEQAWAFFKTLPEHVTKSERLQMLAGQAAAEVKEYSFLDSLFDKEWACVQEGETLLSDLWFRRQAALMAEERGIAYSDKLFEEAKKTLVPPENLDFRMT